VAEPERIVLGFRADTAEEATAQAREWARAEPGLRLRTIASCRRVADPMPSLTAGAPQHWEVTVVVNWLVPA
jgi:hypothetical protein